MLRRDRLRLPLWLVGLGGVIAVSALSVPPIYDTPEKVAGYASAVGTSPVSYLMSGRQAAIDTVDGIVANEISQVAQLGICLMVMFLVVRHTRAEEESGRAELLRSTVLGRHAAPLAGLLYGAAAALVIGLVTTGSMLLAGLDAVGSATYGFGLTLLGLCYVAVSLVAAQLSTSARGALGLAGAAIAVGYLVRGIGALQDSALVWASPFGWAQRMDAFGAERWWPACCWWPSRWPCSLLRAGSPHTATSAAACCRPVPAHRGPLASSGHRSDWSCVCNAACCWGGPWA
jgi:ABC-2 type transport system permease protein